MSRRREASNKVSLRAKINAIIVIILDLILFVTSFNVTSAWFSAGRNKVDSYIKSGSVVTQYFHCGDGSAAHPFVITRPVHYYHLVELYQRGTIINGELFSDHDYYFQLGWDLDEDGDLEFYDYDDFGNTDETYSEILNMAYYSGRFALLPIGTSDVPFNGTFDGSGLTISNLNICAQETVGSSVYSTCDVGVFGFLGEDAIVKDTYIDGLTIDISNIKLTNINGEDHNDGVHTTSDGVVGYVGYIAGHARFSSLISDVYINNATIKGVGNAQNNYGYVGAIENNSGQVIATIGEAVAELRSKGNDVGWGSSLDMQELYNRLYQIARSVRNTGNPTYTTAETVVKDESGKTLARYVTATGNSISNTGSYDLDLVAYTSENGGSYSFNIENGYNPWIYLTGYTQYQTKTVTTYVLSEDKTKTAYFISDKEGLNFLTLSNDLKIVNKGSSEATKWTLDSSNHLFTYVGITPYYLVHSGTTLTISTTASTAWTIEDDSNGGTKFHDGDYYLLYDGVWQITTLAPTLSISDGNGHYMSIKDNAIITTDILGNATEWINNSYDSGAKESFRTTIGTVNKYLAFAPDYGIILSDNEFKWSVTNGSEGAKTYYCSDGVNNWYLAYNDGWNAVRLTGYRIKTTENGVDYYLGLNRFLDSITNVTTLSYLSLWQADLSANSTTIYVNYNGKKYYVGGNPNEGTLVVSDEPVTWTKDANGKYYITYNSKPYYLTYKNGWRIETSDKYTINYNGNYICANPDTYALYNGTSGSTATAWTVQNEEGTGYIYTTIDGTNYYLSVNSSKQLELRTSVEEQVEGGVVVIPAASQWTKSSLGYSTIVDGVTNLLYFDDEWTISEVAMQIIYNDKYYLRYVSSSGSYVVTVTSDSTKSGLNWYYDENSIWMVANNTKYYLTYKGQNQKPTLSTTPNDGWLFSYNDSGKLTIKTANKSYYLACVRENYSNSGVEDWHYVWITPSTGGQYRVRAQLNGSTTYSYMYISIDGKLKKTTNNNSITSFFRLSSTTKRLYSYATDGTTRYLYVDLSNYELLVTTDKTVASEFYYDDTLKRFYFVTADYTKRYIYYDDTGVFKVGIRDFYSFSCDGNYLQLNSSLNGIENSTEGTSERAQWQIDPSVSDGGTTPIYIQINGTCYYLNSSGGNLSISTTEILWNKNATGYFINTGEYLTYSQLNGWCTEPDVLTEFIKDGNKLSVNESGTITNSGTKTGWFYNENGSVYAKIGSNKYYLNITDGVLTTSANSDPGLSWLYDTSDHNLLKTVIGGITYYVLYDSTNAKWIASPSLYYTICSGSTYMAANDSNSIKGASESAAGKWMVLTPTSSTSKIYITVSGTQRYLRWTATEGFSLTTETNGTAFTLTKSGSVVTGVTLKYSETVMYLIYDDSGWNVAAASAYSLKYNSLYYNYNGTTVKGESSLKSYWYFTNFSSKSGNLYSFYNGKVVYMNRSGTSVIYGTSGSTVWSYSNDYLFTDNYQLYVDASAAKIEAITSCGIRATKNGQTRYLNVSDSNSSFSISQGTSLKTKWNYNNGIFSYSSYSGMKYLCIGSTSSNYGGNCSFFYASSSSSATVFTYDSTNHILSGVKSGTTYYGMLYINNGSYNLCNSKTYDSTTLFYLDFDFTKSTAISSVTTSNHSVIGTNGTSITDSDACSKSTVTTVDYTQTLETSSINFFIRASYGVQTVVLTTSITGFAQFSVAVGSIDGFTFNSFTFSSNPIVYLVEREKQSTIIKNQTYGDKLSDPVVQTNQRSGVATYAPIRLALQDEEDNASYYSDYRAHTKNTGYIVSGSYQTSSSYRSDIRVSNYDTSDIGRAFNTYGTPTFNSTYNSRMQVITRTATSNGYVRIDDSYNHSNINSYSSYLPSTAMSVSDLGLTKYITTVEGETSSREELANILMGGNDVYGLHFMEATISSDHIIVADKVTILGKTYYNYELPESCIDFNAYERGCVNFFAGTYYSSNVDAFFSLHQVFRDSNQHITAIKEISKIYQHTVKKEKKAYIYLYTDGTYSTDITAIDFSEYSLVFDLSWITNPTSIVQNALYYFEIPLNKGEYALGSVEGNIGAYLLYLDIAIKGGYTASSTVVADATSSNSLDYDIRTSPDTTPYSLIEFAFNCPNNVDSSKFSVEVSFTKSGVEQAYKNGLYEIYVHNETGQDVDFYVLLIDDDNNANNDYYYAYKITYTNGTHETTTIIKRDVSDTGDGSEMINYWQASAGFVIPSTGDATEIEY